MMKTSLLLSPSLGFRQSFPSVNHYLTRSSFSSSSRFVHFSSTKKSYVLPPPSSLIFTSSLLHSSTVIYRTRTFHGNWSSVRTHCDSTIKPDAKPVAVIFVDKNGTEHRVTGKEGQNIVQLAHEHDIELEGACECSLACSTCHIILEPEVYKNLESPVEEEEDLLDLAFGLTSTSRLGCQVLLTTDMNNRKIRLPAATRNFYVDGHKPKPH